MKFQIVASRSSLLIAVLLMLWEEYVRATHLFLSEGDIQSIKPLVKIGLNEILSLGVLSARNGTPLGFMGVAGTKIECCSSAREQGAKGSADG